MASRDLLSQALKKKIPLGKMHTLSRHAQREKLNEGHVDHIFSRFDLDLVGLMVMSERSDSTYYILDGQHRYHALRRWLGDGWENQAIECRVFTGLTEADEARIFRALNKRLAISTMDNFRTAVVAGERDENAVLDTVRAADLCISTDKVPGAIRAVGTLMKIYRRSDGDTLAKTLRIIRDAYGDAGFEARVIDGIGHLCQRYNGQLDEQVAINKLNRAHGGVKGLLGKAEVLHKQTGNQKAMCVAAAAVDLINQGRGRNKLASWWRN